MTAQVDLNLRYAHKAQETYSCLSHFPYVLLLQKNESPMPACKSVQSAHSFQLLTIYSIWSACSEANSEDPNKISSESRLVFCLLYVCLSIAVSPHGSRRFLMHFLLTLSMLGYKLQQTTLEIYLFFYFPQKIGFHISCKLSPQKALHGM